MTLVRTGNHVGDTESLPKWAQDYIARLEREAKSATKALQELRQANRLTDKGNRFLAEPRLTMVLESTEGNFDQIEARFSADGALEVTGYDLAVSPQASNRVILKSNMPVLPWRREA